MDASPPLWTGLARSTAALVREAAAAFRAVEDVEERILSLVSSKGNLQLGGTVDVIDSISSEPIFNEAIDQRFITNLITLTYRVRG